MENFRNTFELNHVFKFKKQIPDSRHKQYKFMVLNRTFTSKSSKRYWWKITTSPNCEICNTEEDYNHLYIHRSSVQIFWPHIKTVLHKGIQNYIQNLKILVIGYNISHSEYFHLNLI